MFSGTTATQSFHEQQQPRRPSQTSRAGAAPWPAVHCSAMLMRLPGLLAIQAGATQNKTPHNQASCAADSNTRLQPRKCSPCLAYLKTQNTRPPHPQPPSNARHKQSQRPAVCCGKRVQAICLSHQCTAMTAAAGSSLRFWGQLKALPHKSHHQNSRRSVLVAVAMHRTSGFILTSGSTKHIDTTPMKRHQ